MWISCKDRLPEKLQKVLFFWIMEDYLKNISMGFRDDRGWCIYLHYDSFGFNEDIIKVTHWMNIPDFPKFDWRTHHLSNKKIDKGLSSEATKELPETSD